ncbi:MAG: hypothetical protein CMN30_21075 [Sandaracinus sp.]|nr:hypothetical protein [Sandaracinus sp.]
MTPAAYLALWRKFAFFQVVLTAALGFGCLGLSHLVLELIGMEADASTAVLLRTFGASLLFVSILHGTLRQTADLSLIRGLLWANVTEDGLLTALSVMAILSGVMHGLFAWVLAGAFALEVVAAFAMLALRPKS